MSSTSWLEEGLQALQVTAGHRDTTASPAGEINAAAQYRAIQDKIEEHPTPGKSGVHAYRIARAVRADVCASFGRHTQGSYYSESSVWRVLPAVLVRCLLLWLLRCFERRCLCLQQC